MFLFSGETVTGTGSVTKGPESWANIARGSSEQIETDITDTENTTDPESRAYLKVTLPSDLSKLSCDVLKEYGKWTFTYMYSPNAIKVLMCKCRGVCVGVTVPQDVKEHVHKYLYDPLSESNRTEFIAVITAFSLLFALGTIGG